MDIAMLGVSNAGKTSYVTAMYGEMSEARGPFSVTAQRPADHRSLAMNAARMRLGNYPPPTDRRSSYNLRLCYGNEPFFDFVWRDYRGGALSELTATSTQSKQLREDLASTDGLVILIDSTELTDLRRARTKIRPVVSAAVRVLAERKQATPLVIGLTKWDLVRDRQDQVRSVADEALGDLIQSVNRTNHVYGALIPVACGPSPMNVTLPVLWCISIAVVSYYHYVAAIAADREQAAMLAAAERGVVRDIIKWVNGQPTASQEQALFMSQALQLRSHLEPLVRPAESLLGHFDDVYQF